IAAGFPSAAPLAPNGPAAGVSDRIGVTQGVDEFRNQTHFLTLDAFLDIGDDTLELNAGYQDTILRQLHALNLGNAPLTYVDQQFVHTPYDVTSVELRYYSNGRSFWNYMIGADLIRSLSPVFVTQPNDSFINGLALSPTQTIPFFLDTPVNVSIFIPDQATHYSFF